MSEMKNEIAETASRLLGKNGVSVDEAMKELGSRDPKLKAAIEGMFAQIDAAVALNNSVRTKGLEGALRSETDRGFTDDGLDEIAAVTIKYLETMPKGA